MERSEPSSAAPMVLSAPQRLAEHFRAPPVPRVVRRAFSLELWSTLFFSFALAAIDSGVIAVFAKQTFDGVVPAGRLNLAVALLGTMDAFANILSFLWSSASHAQRKIAFINGLQVSCIILIGALAILPRTTLGLTLLVLLVLAARTCWSGIVTIRPTLWRANYPRDIRAKVVGRFSTVQVLTIAVVGFALGFLLDVDRERARSDLVLFRAAAPLACGLAAVAIFLTMRIRMRHEHKWLKHERDAAPRQTPWNGLLVMARVLRHDRRYAQFMLCMFVLGFGNLMVTPMLAITLREEFGLSYLKSIIVTSSAPLLIMPLTIPLWAAFLDRAHVVRFRAIHSWTFVAASVVFFVGAATHVWALMLVGNMLMGLGYAGGSLAWNLGHVDFAPPSETSQYMATHVTLNGVRGLLAPITAVALYESLKRAGLDATMWVFAFSMTVSLAGALGFVALRLSMGRGVEAGVARLT